MPSDNLASQIPDSLPLPNASLIHGTPTRLLQRYLGHPPGPCSEEVVVVPSSPDCSSTVNHTAQHLEGLESVPATEPASSQDSECLAIRPPSPAAGVANLRDPAALVSDRLAKLADDLSSRYRPETVRALPLDPLERGYWLLDCRAWPPAARADAWVFLRNYLRGGLAGWAVWCTRGAGHDWIRLYAFAGLAKHTYLLLYLASGRLLKTTGAKWLDADGLVALQVPGVERRGLRE